MDPQSPQPKLTMPGGLSEEELQRLIVEATMKFRQVDPSGLSGDSQAQYDAARRFLAAAHENFSNPRLASKFADKANVIFGVLSQPQPSQDPTDRGLVGLLKPFLGSQD